MFLFRREHELTKRLFNTLAFESQEQDCIGLKFQIPLISPLSLVHGCVWDSILLVNLSNDVLINIVRARSPITKDSCSVSMFFVMTFCHVSF